MNKGFNYNKILTAIIYIVIFAGAITFIFPYIWMVINSFKSLGEILTYPPTIFPKVWTLINYIEAIDYGFGKYFLNSIAITITTTLLILYTSAYLGYLLGKIKFKGQSIIFVLILTTMMIPWPIIIVPLYNFMVQLGWIDTYQSVILPYTVHAFGIFLVRQFVLGISDEIIESAELDGASQFRIFHNIVIPQLGPALSALGIFIFLWMWDNLLWPYLVLTTPEHYTLPVGLRMLKGQYFDEMGQMLAASSITIMPILLVFLFAQRRFIDGMSFTGVKQ